MHTDLVPIIEDSEIHIDAHIENGKLGNYPMLQDFSEYFKDKNLESVKFDTLENKIDMVKWSNYSSKNDHKFHAGVFRSFVSSRR